MTKEELTIFNVGCNLDTLMNLDPRGYGVCRILYDGARKFTGEPLSTNGAKGLIKNIKKVKKYLYSQVSFFCHGKKRKQTALFPHAFLQSSS